MGGGFLGLVVCPSYPDSIEDYRIPLDVVYNFLRAQLLGIDYLTNSFTDALKHTHSHTHTKTYTHTHTHTKHTNIHTRINTLSYMQARKKELASCAC